MAAAGWLCRAMEAMQLSPDNEDAKGFTLLMRRSRVCAAGAGGAELPRAPTTAAARQQTAVQRCI